MIASHNAEPGERQLSRAAARCSGPAGGSELVRELEAGEPFMMLDETLGWAWGYAGDERRVGYVESDALRSQCRTEA